MLNSWKSKKHKKSYGKSLKKTVKNQKEGGNETMGSMGTICTVLGIIFLVLGFGFALWDEFLRKND